MLQAGRGVHHDLIGGQVRAHHILRIFPFKLELLRCAVVKRHGKAGRIVLDGLLHRRGEARGEYRAHLRFLHHKVRGRCDLLTRRIGDSRRLRVGHVKRIHNAAHRKIGIGPALHGALRRQPEGIIFAHFTGENKLGGDGQIGRRQHLRLYLGGLYGIFNAVGGYKRLLPRGDRRVKFLREIARQRHPVGRREGIAVFNALARGDQAHGGYAVKLLALLDQPIGVSAAFKTGLPVVNRQYHPALGAQVKALPFRQNIAVLVVLRYRGVFLVHGLIFLKHLAFGVGHQHAAKEAEQEHHDDDDGSRDSELIAYKPLEHQHARRKHLYAALVVQRDLPVVGFGGRILFLIHALHLLS